MTKYLIANEQDYIPGFTHSKEEAEDALKEMFEEGMDRISVDVYKLVPVTIDLKVILGE